MNQIIVTNQAEWDAAIERHRNDYVSIYVDAPAGVVLRIDETGSSRAVLRGSSRAVLWGSSSAELRDSSRAVLRGSSRAVLWGSSSAELRDSSSAELWGSSRAVLWGSSSAVLRGSSRAVLRGSSRAVLWGSSSAELRDSSSAELWGSSSAVLRGSSRAVLWGSSSAVLRGSSSAELRDSSSAELWGSSSAVLRGSSSAELWGSSSAELWGFSTAHAHDRSTVKGGTYTAVFIHCARVTVDGGVIIDLTSINQLDPATWVELHADVDDDGMVHPFKAVDGDLYAGHAYYLTQYPIGETITDPRWRDDNACGGGLHVSPTPRHARDHYWEAERFLEVVVPLADIRPIDETKIKAESLTILREVDIDGNPIEVAK
ncbi:hypothetical protein EDD28_0044 [Salana multivorans]|uniref:DUF7666 domain-containing protein n=1 Tax=Salana multivorans TaxID=120377 RepID=A0A3N2D6S7_9MICO|nr:hypothetical protein [Salana multivorans]ROR95491.1 hypothetical protein EDD28_0044 [Salana multivorans]